MQVFAQGDQSAAALSLLNGREALLLAQPDQQRNARRPRQDRRDPGQQGRRSPHQGMPGQHETSTEGTVASDDGGPLTVQAKHQLTFLGVGIQARAVDAGAVLAHHGARGSCIQQVFEALSTRESVDPQVASIEGCDSPQPMLLGHPGQRSVSQIHRQIAVLPHRALHILSYYGCSFCPLTMKLAGGQGG